MPLDSAFINCTSATSSGGVGGASTSSYVTFATASAYWTEKFHWRKEVEPLFEKPKNKMRVVAIGRRKPSA